MSKKQKTAGRGRPPRADRATVRSAVIYLKLTAEEKARIKAAAAENGQRPAVWAREVLLSAAAYGITWV
jgi:hypothetical protein